MNIYAALFAVAVAGIAAGGWITVGGVVGRAVADSPFRTRLSRVRKAGEYIRSRRRLASFGAAIAVGIAVFALSGWPVAGALVAIGVVGVPYFFGAARIASRRIERLEALEEWVRRLADAMGAGSAPIQSIVRSAERAPEPIRSEVGQLASRLSTPRLDRESALQSFADEIDDSLGDMVVLALGIAVSTQSTQRVPQVLRELASQVSDEVRARRKVETDRAEPRNEARTIVVVQVLFVVGISIFTGYTKVYGTLTGQLVLGGFGMVAVVALWLLRRFSMGVQLPRILPTVGER